jgi:hypothetical protein
MYNEYEASEIVEVGQAEEMILGYKDQEVADQVGSTPTFLRSTSFADYDE